ncbi:MAG: hypothetical protein WAM05_01440 [Candidatus Binataceae bacterium]
MLADDVLFGKLTKGGKVTVDVIDNKLTFEYNDLPIKHPAPVG